MADTRAHLEETIVKRMTDTRAHLEETGMITDRAQGTYHKPYANERMTPLLANTITDYTGMGQPPMMKQNGMMKHKGMMKYK